MQYILYGILYIIIGIIIARIAHYFKWFDSYSNDNDAPFFIIAWPFAILFFTLFMLWTLLEEIPSAFDWIDKQLIRVYNWLRNEDGLSNRS